MYDEKLIFEKGKAERKSYVLPKINMDIKIENVIDKKYLRDNDLMLPEISESEAARHYIHLSTMNYGVDTGFYPLGSCTMKYNPKINEDISKMDGFVNVHPYQNEDTVQGCLKIMYETKRLLSKITGMDNFTLQPAAGAHGELTGLMIIKEYFRHKEDEKRKIILIPDSAHGTNPASAAMAGFEVLEIKSDVTGLVNINHLKDTVDSNKGEIAGLMLTNPNTLGLFEKNILMVTQIIHKDGGLLYYDGANTNAIMGITNPKKMGFDIVHLNLHKTFSTPHGCGGPGAGPVGVISKLEKYLPYPVIKRDKNNYYLDYDRKYSIGKTKSFYGNFNVIVKAMAYILQMGEKGLKETSENAILNANYLLNRLKDYYEITYGNKCMHEFVISAEKIKEKYGISAMDIAKRLMDYGFHPPTVYFPLIVKEALMIEVPETEAIEEIDRFAKAMILISREIKENPKLLHEAPHNRPVRRPDEVLAARNPVVVYKKS